MFMRSEIKCWRMVNFERIGVHMGGEGGCRMGGGSDFMVMSTPQRRLLVEYLQNIGRLAENLRLYPSPTLVARLLLHVLWVGVDGRHDISPEGHLKNFEKYRF